MHDEVKSEKAVNAERIELLDFLTWSCDDDRYLERNNLFVLFHAIRVEEVKTLETRGYFRSFIELRKLQVIYIHKSSNYNVNFPHSKEGFICCCHVESFHYDVFYFKCYQSSLYTITRWT